MNYLYENLTSKIIGLSIEVHKELGPGLLENIYKQCLAYELNKVDIKFKMKVEIPIIYKKIKINCNYKIDLIVENKVVIELKCVEKVLSIHEAQLLTYLKISNIRVKLLINFNEYSLKNGIKRLIL